MSALAVGSDSKRFKLLVDVHVKMLQSWRASIDGPRAIAAAFPTVSAALEAGALESLYSQFWDQLEVNAMAEFAKIAEENSVEAKLSVLEQMMAGHDAGRVALPAAAMPEDEMRSATMDIKLEYEKRLLKLLHTLRRENDAQAAAVASEEAAILDLTSEISSLEAAVAKVATAAGVSETAGSSGDSA